MKKDIVVGLGEIGNPILKILSKKNIVVGFDLNRDLMDKIKFEKYKNLAKEALSGGDKILYESYLQHSDHFSRILSEVNTLKTKNNPNPTASMVPNGYLLLFGPKHAEEQYEALKNHKACDAGTKNIPASKLKEIFSWVNPEGLETATYTDNKIEGWIDPHMFHNALKNKAIELGTKFEKGDVKKISDIKAKTIVSAAGCWTKELLDDVPVVPQKHTVFRVKCPKHYPEMPLTGDLPSGVYWRPEGKEYVAGSPNSKFDCPDLEPEWEDFENLVWPALANRVPEFEQLKLTGGWAGYYDCNVLDNNAIVGKHPKYENVFLATGFTGRGLMQSPGIGRGLTELITTGKYQTIDLSCFGLDRIFAKQKRIEPYVL